MKNNDIYYIWLQNILEYGSHKLQNVISYFGDAKTFYESHLDDKKSSQIFSNIELNRIKTVTLEESERVIKSCDKYKMNILTYESSLYPERLKNIYNPPAVLYYKGVLKNIDEQIPIALVGTRSATQYGANLTLNLAHNLTKCGITIVSGGAFGIDTEALTGAINAKGSPICVLGGGLNKYYPKQNKKLFDIISENGIIMTEYQPDTNPIGRNFPARNRILSGLSIATIVVEAPKKSGALITANLSLEQGRDVFAVPGNIGSDVSVGTNGLLKLGAIPLTSYKDVVDEYIDKYPDKIKDIINSQQKLNSKKTYKKQEKNEIHSNDEKTYKSSEPHKSPEQITGISDNAKKIYCVLSCEPKYLDELARQTNIEIRMAMISLTELQLHDLVTEHPGKRFTLK